VIKVPNIKSHLNLPRGQVSG